MTTAFTTLNANTLDDVYMIAGDERLFVYNIYDDIGNAISIDASSCSVLIFKYGDPNYLITSITGSIVEIPNAVNNQFSAVFSGSGLSGLYQQQVKIVDRNGITSIPAQGKIYIFSSPTS